MRFICDHRMLVVLISLLIFSTSCAPSDSDEGASAADDAGDDAGDDTQDDDSSDDADDDSSNDDSNADDAIDDDSDDDSASDDDSTDDDVTWPAVCEDPSPGADDCAETMRKLYCDLGYPVIKDDVSYSQTGAVSACRDGIDPVWADILECSLNFTGYTYESDPGIMILFFVYCLSDLGWPAQQTDIFDATLWMPEDVTTPINGVYQSLNFWAIGVIDVFYITEFAGAVVDPAAFSIRADFGTIYIDGRTWYVRYEIGDATSYDDTAVTFWMEGWWWSCRADGWYDEGEVAEFMRLVPAAP